MPRHAIPGQCYGMLLIIRNVNIYCLGVGIIMVSGIFRTLRIAWA